MLGEAGINIADMDVGAVAVGRVGADGARHLRAAEPCRAGAAARRPGITSVPHRRHRADDPSATNRYRFCAYGFVLVGAVGSGARGGQGSIGSGPIGRRGQLLHRHGDAVADRRDQGQTEHHAEQSLEHGATVSWSPIGRSLTTSPTGLRPSHPLCSSAPSLPRSFSFVRASAPHRCSPNLLCPRARGFLLCPDTAPSPPPTTDTTQLHGRAQR